MYRWVGWGGKGDLEVPGPILTIVINTKVKILENRASRLKPPNGPSPNMGPAHKSCRNLVSVRTSSGHWCCELRRCWKSTQRLIIYSVNSCFWNVFWRGLQINIKHKNVDTWFRNPEYVVFTVCMWYTSSCLSTQNCCAFRDQRAFTCQCLTCDCTQH
jgi:hypothetical protein